MNTDAGDLSANLGRLPVLTVGDVSIGQMSAIADYVAGETNMMGDSHIEAAKIRSICESLKEFNEAYRKLVTGEPTVEQSETWFNGGATDVTGLADPAGQSTRYMTWYLSRIEEILGDNGFAVGNRLSLADVYVFVALGDSLSEELHDDMPQYKREPFGSKEKTDAAVAKYPKLAASVAAVRDHPNMQKWLSIRGKQLF